MHIFSDRKKNVAFSRIFDFFWKPWSNGFMEYNYFIVSESMENYFTLFYLVNFQNPNSNGNYFALVPVISITSH